MNDILREKFVEVYTQPLLHDLKENLQNRFPGVEFPDVPPTGDLNLEDVKKSKYFFQ